MVLQFLYEIPSDQFSDFQQIGYGSCSSIFSAIHTQTQVRVALKIILKTDDWEKMKMVYQEIKILRSLNHPFICQYYDDFETEHLIIISMELIEGICLIDYVNRKSGLIPQEAQNIFSQLVIAIEYLHTVKNVSHRDLKLDNIMIDNYNHIRLIDFGFSSPKVLMTTLCGSLPYCAPEVVHLQGYTNKADIWCLGIILYAIITGKLPFYDPNMHHMIKNICEKEPDYSIIFDEDIQNLISKLLIKNPNRRITIDEIKNHIFISHVSLLNIDYRSLFSPSSIHQNNDQEIVEQPKIQKSSSSNSNIPYLNYNIQSDLELKKPKKYLTSNNQLLISNLKQIITKDTDNVNDLIMSRKDYSLNLNKLIETALIEFTPCNVRNNETYTHFKPILPIVPNFRNIHLHPYKFSHNNVIIPKHPFIAKPF